MRALFCYLSNSPRGREKVYWAGVTTRLSQASPIFPPKAENGADTTKTAPPVSVATIPRGRQRSRSSVIATGEVCFFCRPSAAAAAFTNTGLKQSSITSNSLTIVFLCVHINFSFSNKLPTLNHSSCPVVRKKIELLSRNTISNVHQNSLTAIY